jgi:hypothetical protein
LERQIGRVITANMLYPMSLVSAWSLREVHSRKAIGMIGVKDLLEGPLWMELS